MRKGLLLFTTFTGVVFAQEVEPIVYPRPVSKVELNLSLGLVDFKEKYLDRTYYLRLGADYRAKYPFLVGVGLKASSSSDIFMLYPDLRVKARLALFSTLKFDLFGGTSVGYAENKTIDKKKLIAGAFAGGEILYFMNSVSFGVGVSYHMFTDSRFNHLQAGINIGF